MASSDGHSHGTRQPTGCSRDEAEGSGAVVAWISPFPSGPLPFDWVAFLGERNIFRITKIVNPPEVWGQFGVRL